MSYYLCDQKTGRALAGPWTQTQLTTFINLEPKATRYNTYSGGSRYALAKDVSKFYPKTKAGETQLAADLGASPLKGIEPPPTIHPYHWLSDGETWKEEVRAWSKKHGIPIEFESMSAAELRARERPEK